MKNLNLFFFLSMLAIIFPQIALAQTSSGTGIDTMFANFTSSATSLISMVQTLSEIIAVCVAIAAIYDLTKFAEDSRNGYKSAITKLAVAGLLASVTMSMNTAEATLGLTTSSNYWDTANASIFTSGLSGASSTVSTFSTNAIQGVILFIKLIGNVAFIKGILILKDIGNGRGEATFGKAFTHIFGGAACINLEVFVQMLETTFGISSSST